MCYMYKIFLISYKTRARRKFDASKYSTFNIRNMSLVNTYLHYSMNKTAETKIVRCVYQKPFMEKIIIITRYR